MNTISKTILILSLLLGSVAWAYNSYQQDVTDDQTKINDEEGINFYTGPWPDAKKMAEDEDKLIFLDAMASWCGPCKAMEKKTFTNSEVAQFFNKNFINVSMDMEKHQNGPQLRQKYEINNYPTLLFIDQDGKIVKKSLGFKNAQQMLKLGKAVE